MKVVIIRHGLTEWSTRFTGWTDIDIVDQGVKDTQKFSSRLKEQKIIFDIAFTSYLKRGIRTLWTALDTLDQMWIPVVKAWQLNERHYGALQGLNKAETVAKYGENQVNLWRRSYDVPPPKLDNDDPRQAKNDIRYKNVTPNLLPNGESLKDTYNRSVPYWKKFVEPEMKKNKNIILSGHHNSLRSIIKYLDNISDSDIVKLNVPYCIPLVYEFDNNLKQIKHYYLADDQEIQAVIDQIKNQTKK